MGVSGNAVPARVAIDLPGLLGIVGDDMYDAAGRRLPFLDTGHPLLLEMVPHDSENALRMVEGISRRSARGCDLVAEEALDSPVTIAALPAVIIQPGAGPVHRHEDTEVVAELNQLGVERPTGLGHPSASPIDEECRIDSSQIVVNDGGTTRFACGRRALF